MTVTGATTLKSTLAVTGATTLAGLTATTGSFSSTLTVTGATTLKSTLAVTGATTLAGLTATTGSFSSTLSVTGATTLAGLTATTGSFSSTLSVTGATTLADTLTTRDITPNADVTYNIGKTGKAYKYIYSQAYNINNGNYNYGMLYMPTAGTTTVLGEGRLTLGNNTAKGTAGNAYGRIIMYGEGSGYTVIKPGYNAASSISISLPSSGGTLALTTSTVAKANAWANNASLTIGNASAKTLNAGSALTWTLDEIGAAPKHDHLYLALSGGTVSGATTFSNTLTASGRFTANGRITVPSVGGSWVSGMTLTNCSIQVSTKNTSGSYHPIIGGQTYNGHFWNIGSYVDQVGFYGFKSGRTANATDWTAVWDVATGNFTNTGTITGSKIYNAVWNDYAEWYEREDLEETVEPGDIVTWSEDGVVKTTEAFDPCVVGVYSDTYGHIVGGEWLDDMEDNIKKNVPVGLCGRVHVKVVGKANRGDLIVSSDIPGVGMAISPKDAYPGVIIGKVLKKKDSEEIEKIKIQIMLQ